MKTPEPVRTDEEKADLIRRMREFVNCMSDRDMEFMVEMAQDESSAAEGPDASVDDAHDSKP